MTTTRTCTLCDGEYRAGRYSAHASAHVPLRKSKAGPAGNDDLRTTIRAMLATVPQAEIARRLGVSRQRVHQIAHADPLGRPYRADAVNARARTRG